MIEPTPESEEPILISKLPAALEAGKRYVIDPELADQPTPASGETRQELYRIIGFDTPQYVEDIGIVCTNIPASRFEEIISELEQLIAAAVQAESRKLLERLKQQILGNYSHRSTWQNSQINGQLVVELFERELAVLDSEQQKLGGK